MFHLHQNPQQQYLTWNLKLSTTWKTSLARFLKLQCCNSQQFAEVYYTHFLKLKRWISQLEKHFFTLENLQHFEEVCSTHFLKLKRWISQQLEKHFSTLENLQHFEEVSSTPFTHLKSCKLLVSHHLEMNSHSLCKLRKNFL